MLPKMAIRLALLTSLMLAGANAALLTYSGGDPNRSFDFWFNAAYLTGDQLLPSGTPSPTDQTIDVNVTAGIANLLVDGQSLDALCVDFFVVISNNTYNVNVLGPNAIGNGTRVAWMLRNILPTINSQSNGLTKRQQSAGLQLAAWDIIHDGGDGFSAGRIQQSQSTPTDSMVLLWANAYLGGSAGQSLQDGYTLLFQNQSGNSASQRLLTADVPEPSTYAMMLSAGALLCFARRRWTAVQPHTYC